MKLSHLALIVLAFAGLATPAAAQAKKPNIVFILADDAGYGDFGFSGHPYVKTPALDKLAKQSTFFKNFYVGGATCCPSRTSLMTARFTASFQKYPAQHGFSGAVTITEILRRLGYRIGHFGKWHIGTEHANGTYGMHDIKVSGGDRKDPRGRDAVIADNAIAFMRANKDQPFYVNVWFHTPHSPVSPPQPFVERFKDVKVNPLDFKGPYMQDYLKQAKESGESIDVEMRKRLGDLSQLDEQVARLLKTLDDLGLSENTIVVFTSDNGPNAYGFASILRGRKHDLHDGGVRLPLLVRWPGQVPAGRVDEKSVIAGVDWLPTVTTIAGGKLDAKEAKDLVGEDVSDIWLGKERPRAKDLFWKTNAPGSVTAMRHGDWKFYLPTKKKGTIELFNLTKDPAENLNVATQQPALVRELTAAVQRWQATLPKSYEGSEKDKGD